MPNGSPPPPRPRISPLVGFWFDCWARAALRRQFHRVHRFGDPDWKTRFDPQIPHLYIANHASFWDGVLLYHLIRRYLRQPAYCLIDQRQMRQHRFFARVGGIGLNRERRRDALRVLDVAAGLLAPPPSASGRPANAVVLFPEGQIRPVDQRPIRFEPAGLARLIRRCPVEARVVVVALRYDFWTEQRGEALLHLCPPEPAGMLAHLPRDELVATLASRLTSAADALRATSLRQQPGEVLLWGKRSISQWPRSPGR